MGFLWILSFIWVKILDEVDYRKGCRAAQIKSGETKTKKQPNSNVLDAWIVKQQDKQSNQNQMMPAPPNIKVVKQRVRVKVKTSQISQNPGNFIVGADPILTYGGPIKDLECIVKKRLKVEFFANLKDGKSFRFNNEWCCKTGADTYADGYLNNLELPKYTYIAAHPKNFVN